MAKRKQAVGVRAIFGLVRELKKVAEAVGEVAVGGAPAQASELRRALADGGDASVVRAAPSKETAAFVYVLAGPPGAPELRDLREASRKGVPIVAVTEDTTTPIPYVLATNVVHPSEGVAGVAEALASVLGELAAPLAGKLPVLRAPVSSKLIESYARRNALIGAAVFIPGADMPVMTLNQMALVMRLAAAHGVESERKRVLELASVLGTGLGFRYVGRSLLGLIPVAGFAVRAGVGYTGTKAVGEAAVKYYSTLED